MLFGTRFILISLSIMGSAACLFAEETIADANNIVIGLLLPPEEPAAAGLSNSAILSVEQANQLPGPHVSLVIRGRTGQWGADGVEAARMVTDDGAQGLIAPPDGAASHLVLQVSGRTAVPVVSLCADSSVTQTGVPWMVRAVPSTIEEATTLFTDLPKGHWVAVVPDGRAGEEVACDLKRAATHSGCFIEKMIEIEPSLTNAARFAKKILKNRPDVIFLWLDPAAAGRLAKGLRAAGYAGTLAGPSRLRAVDLIATEGALEGLLVPSPVLEKGAVATFQRFADAFRARFGHEPDATAAEAYDAATLLICVLRNNAGHSAREAFPHSLLFTGASGLLSFDDQGNRKSALRLLEARGGRFVPRKSGATNSE